MSDLPKTRTLTMDEMITSANRLSTRHRSEVSLKPLVQQRSLPQEEMEKSIKHLYDDSLAHRKQRLQEIEESVNAEIDKYHAGRKRLDTVEQENMVNRLYDRTLEQREQTFRELYDRERAFLSQKTKTLTKKEQTEAVTRLYTEGMERNRKKNIALFEKFVLSRRPNPIIRSREDVLVACDKLWKGEGVTSA